ANMDRGSFVIDAPLDQPKDYVIDVYLHPRPEIAKTNRVHFYWNGLPSNKQETVDGKLVQTGLIDKTPELWKFEDECLSEHNRMAYVEGKKGTPQQKINELLTAHITEVTEKYDRLVADYVRDNKPVYSYNADYDLASIPRLFIESWEVEGPIVEWPSRGR